MRVSYAYLFFFKSYVRILTYYILSYAYEYDRALCPCVNEAPLQVACVTSFPPQI